MDIISAVNCLYVTRRNSQLIKLYNKAYKGINELLSRTAQIVLSEENRIIRRKHQHRRYCFYPHPTKIGLVWTARSRGLYFRCKVFVTRQINLQSRRDINILVLAKEFCTLCLYVCVSSFASPSLRSRLSNMCGLHTDM